jgi:hypothetical protein
MRKFSLVASAVLAAAMLFTSTRSANATLTLFTGIQGGNTGTDNVIFNACTGNQTGPALTFRAV